MYLFSRFTYQKLQKKNILIVDDSNINHNFEFDDVEFINPRRVYLNYIIISIFKCIINFKLKKKELKRQYLDIILKKINPKISICNNINGFNFEIKKNNPNIKTIIYQHSYIYDFEIEKFKELYKNKYTDYFLVFDERHKNIFEKLMRSKFIKAGSLINNSIRTVNQKKYIDILFISEFRKENPKFKIDLEKKLLLIISNYCKSNNLNLYIALNSIRKDKKIKLNDEINFYNNLNINFTYELDKNSYELADYSNLILCISSNLGIELLSKNKKVLFLNLMYEHNHKFRNPYFVNDNPFNLLKFDKKEIYSKIDRLINHNSNLWYEKNINFNDMLIFDDGNKILKKLVNSIL